MGLLTRPEWRRTRRAYEIRRDLEHEDEDYEADVEDILYVFKTSIEAILSREPVELLRIGDVQEVVNSDEPASPTAQFLKDYQSAPEPRQVEITAFLVDTATNSKNADIVRQNAVELLRSFEPLTKQQVKIEIGQIIQERINRGRLDLVVGKVAAAAGVLRYLKQRQVAQLFDFLVKRLEDVGYHWKESSQHGPSLDDIEDVGGLLVCPPDIRNRLVRWMTLCYLGEPGRYGTWGRNREVFYSDSASRRIARMLRAAGAKVKDDLESALNDKRARAAVSNRHIARRAEKLRDLSLPGEE
jgi:N-acyl-L-homoserine lactone synthetase